MKGGAALRLATAEIHWGRDRGAIAWIGNRALHQFWTVLAPYFRDILLAPLRRPDDEKVTWTWREGAERRVPTGAELTALRKRLASDQRAFANHVREAGAASGGPANLREIGNAMEQTVERLLSLPDAELTGFVACTETGLRLHSWGAARAAETFFPEERKPEAENIVVAPGGPVPRVPRRRRAAAVWLVAAGVAVGVGWWWRVSPAGAQSKPTAHATETVAKDFAVGRASRELGDGDERRPGPARGPVVANASVAAGSETRRTTAATVVRDVADRGLLEEFESKRAVPKALLAPPDAGPAGASDSASTSAGAAGPVSAAVGGAVGAGGGGGGPLAAGERGPARAGSEEARESNRVEQALAAAEARSVEAERRALKAERRQPRGTKERDARPGPEVGAATLDGSAAAFSSAGRVAWATAVRVSVTRWSVRLLADAIVPTEPRRVGSAGGLAEARARTMAEWRERLPAAFTEVRGRRGVAIEGGRGAFRWRAPFGSERVATKAGEGSAELSWAEGEPPPRGIFELVDERERRVALVETEAGDDAVLHVTDGARAWFWRSIEGATACGWRLEAGGELPPGWRPTTDGRTARLDVPLDVVSGATATEAVALFDAASGWAIVSRVTRAALEEP